MERRADQIQVGDYVDLEGDAFCDPGHNNPAFECEYQIVSEVERETHECVAITFEGFDTVGFPPDHILTLKSPAPQCSFCEEEPRDATFLAAQSVDQGRTVSWLPICASHREGWNDGSDWKAPIYRLNPKVEI